MEMCLEGVRRSSKYVLMALQEVVFQSVAVLKLGWQSLLVSLKRKL